MGTCTGTSMGIGTESLLAQFFLAATCIIIVSLHMDEVEFDAAKMARGETEYQGKLLEARQSDWKDEFILLILSAPVVVLAWAVVSEDPAAMDKVKLFFEYFSQLPQWFTNLWILVVASVYGIKGTQIWRNGKK